MNSEDRIVRFQGVIEEIKCIGVDYFRNLNAGAYFLSHCHADHMAGLSSAELFNYVKSSNVKIYCSVVSKNILSHWPNYSHLVPHLESQEINCPYSLEVQNKDGSEKTSFCVTLLSSGHCPGSVMFLFEGNFGNILYTGDFRLGIGDGTRMLALREDSRRKNSPLKQLDHVYLDCTFCFPKAETLPLRTHVLLEIAKVIESWVGSSSEHHVLLSTSARFGSEFLFVEIFEKLKMQIHVSEDKYDMYKNIKVLRRAITKDGRSTRIHSCLSKGVFNQVNTLPCFGDKREAKICTIRPTTQWHLWKGHSEVIVKDKEMYRVLYSMHSSLQEIQDFVRSLKPRRITPISKPDDVTIDQIQTLLNCTVTSPEKILISKANGRVRSVTSESGTAVQGIPANNIPDVPQVLTKPPAVKDDVASVNSMTSLQRIHIQNEPTAESSAVLRTSNDGKVAEASDAVRLVDAVTEIDSVTGKISNSEMILTSVDHSDASGSVQRDSSHAEGLDRTGKVREVQIRLTAPSEGVPVRGGHSETGFSHSPSVEKGLPAIPGHSQCSEVKILTVGERPVELVDLDEEAGIATDRQSGSQSSVEVIDIITVESQVVKTPDRVRNSSSLEFEFDSPSLFEVGRHEVVFSQCKRRLVLDSDEETSAKARCPEKLTGESSASTEDVIIID